MRLSTAVRVSLVAGLLAAILATGFAFWMRHEIYATRYKDLQYRAEQARNLMMGNLRAVPAERSWPFSFEHPPTDQVVEIVEDNGNVPEYSSELSAHVDDDGPALQPLPAKWAPRSSQDRQYVTFGAPNPERLDAACGSGATQEASTCQDIKNLAGRRIEYYRGVVPLAHLPVDGGKSFPGDGRSVAVAVYVLPFEAEDAVAAADRVLIPAVPIGVLLIMLGAYVTTRVALRPVERMRALAATISETNLHERVPVPPTGDVLAALATTLNETLARLETSADQQRGFIADAAHELRSPIAALRAILEVAAAHPDRADWPRTVATAVEETRRLQDLADDLLLIARLDADPAPTPTSTVDLAELTRRHLARRLDEGPTLTLESPDHVPVTGNPAQLDRILRNLLDNALRHATTQVTVTLTTTPTAVLLHVTDDGPGIPTPDQTRIFTRFTRLDDSRTRPTGGAGLGLSIAQDLAHRHHATLAVTPTPHPGTRLTLTLPNPTSPT
ncbi:HAMP domain-containing histidine kinase [Kribbella sandramycini]|uniref:histidine kinase n=1 Tax=Kribbella sandramycini TaxID=60450 RepID=A0A7Y4P2L3_9ACTN|nr:HAMP domain-containing sensor histidine kinase [Kribbella sandramycini]MBB6571381.1 signal transduction histidine kinase [Kribbella sandramycini]NOL43219.1 HAMP domain-containing histidine kinase [Kribbella sandramycini]